MVIAELPEAERPKAVTAAVAELESRVGRLREVEQHRFEAAERQMKLRREANGVLVGEGGATKRRWDEAQERWREAQEDFSLAEQVVAAAERAVSEARETLAAAVVKHSDRWRQALERRWLGLDVE